MAISNSTINLPAVKTQVCDGVSGFIDNSNEGDWHEKQDTALEPLDDENSAAQISTNDAVCLQLFTHDCKNGKLKLLPQ